MQVKQELKGAAGMTLLFVIILFVAPFAASSPGDWVLEVTADENFTISADGTMRLMIDNEGVLHIGGQEIGEDIEDNGLVFGNRVHIENEDNVAGSLCFHIGTTPLVDPTGYRLWMDNMGTLWLLGPNANPAIEVNYEMMRLEADGSVYIDDNLFVIDNENNRIGVGTANPKSILHMYKFAESADDITNVLIIATHDITNTHNLSNGVGGGILFMVPDDDASGASEIGSRIAGFKDSNGETSSSSGLIFEVSNDDNTLDEAMRITSVGRVGIGDSAPSRLLDIQGEGDYIGIDITSTGGGGESFSLLVGDNSGSIPASFAIYDKGEDFRFVIDDNGKVGIGTTTPSTTLEVSGYTMLGSEENTPKIKMLKFTGTLPSGASANIAHGIDITKVISHSTIVVGGGMWLAPEYTGVAGYHYSFYMNSTSLAFRSIDTNLYAMPYTVLVIYEE